MEGMTGLSPFQSPREILAAALFWSDVHLFTPVPGRSLVASLTAFPSISFYISCTLLDLLHSRICREDGDNPE